MGIARTERQQTSLGFRNKKMSDLGGARHSQLYIRLYVLSLEGQLGTPRGADKGIRLADTTKSHRPSSNGPRTANRDSSPGILSPPPSRGKSHSRHVSYPIPSSQAEPPSEQELPLGPYGKPVGRDRLRGDFSTSWRDALPRLRTPVTRRLPIEKPSLDVKVNISANCFGAGTPAS